MDENAKKIQREIAKDKIQVILASIALAVLIIMEFYIMINFKSNFIAINDLPVQVGTTTEAFFDDSKSDFTHL